eukprot:1143188-Pelagomonas_calceolata.AAC.9
MHYISSIPETRHKSLFCNTLLASMTVAIKIQPGTHAGLVGEYAGEVGEYAGEVGEYLRQTITATVMHWRYKCNLRGSQFQSSKSCMLSSPCQRHETLVRTGHK